MFNNLRKQLARVIYTARNSMSLPDQFLRYGSQKTMMPDWSNVLMSDQDHYSGYSYAAIRNRANTVARIASAHLRTEVPDSKETSKTTDTHPYIPLVRESTLFSENMFWTEISTYLDLEGVYYLMVIRNPNVDANPTGKKEPGAPLQFKLLNPYDIKRVINTQTMEVTGYIEIRNGFQREIAPEMIIEMRDLNPFNRNVPFAMTDAAKESSFTLKSAGDYTRHVLRNNVDAPGIITTDVIMPEPEFKNFVARMKDHTKGEPVFGNGASAVKWTPMNIDLSKAALSDINEVNRDPLFAITGVSKTLMGIEQSGTTRETSNVQKDLFLENQIVPRVNLILDSLNLDYKTRYASEYKTKPLSLGIDNPIESDHDTEQKKVNIKQTNYDLFKEMTDDGYEEKIAAEYADGVISLEEVGPPTKEPKLPPMPVVPVTTPKVIPPVQPKGKKKQYVQLNEVAKGVIQDQESMLQNSIVNAEGNLAASAISHISKIVKNAADDSFSQDDLIPQKDQKETVNELILVLTAFYGIIASIQGKETIADRIEQYGGSGKFLLDKISKDGIKKTAEAVASSHVDTVSADLYKTAREAALKGKSQQEIISELKTKYSHDVTENRARTVARTETNRAFTMAQYDADRQFIAQNELGARAFKQYETRSANPCPFCESIVGQGLIPFDDPFVKKGDSVTAKVDGEEVTFNVNFESVYAGNLHPNCSCDYRLVIIPEKQN